MIFGLISTLSSILIPFSVIGTEKVSNFLVFSPRQLNSPLNSFASSVMMKYHSLNHCEKPLGFF